ncbi:MAG: hypothetical protein WCX31_18005 [Salinivirgaceae bacterium]|jgi:hypothetical protein
MKIVGRIIIVLLIMATYSCHYQQNKLENKNIPAANEIASDNSAGNSTNYFEQQESDSKKELISEIVSTSPRFKQTTNGLTEKVIKNGGLAYELRLERCPDNLNGKKWNYSKTYDFTLYEVYADRKLNTNSFSFDPSINQLYEYNAISDKFEPIEFDRSLFFRNRFFLNWR